MFLKSLFPFIIGLTVWGYGTFLLVNKIQLKISDNNLPEET